MTVSLERRQEASRVMLAGLTALAADDDQIRAENRVQWLRLIAGLPLRRAHL